MTEVFEGSRRILMLEGVRMLSREPPTFRRGLPEEFIRGVWEFWGFEYPRDRPPGVRAIIRFTLAKRGLATGSGTEGNEREGEEVVRSSVSPRRESRDRSFRPHPGEGRSRGVRKKIAVDYASRAVQDSPETVFVVCGEVEFGAQEAKHGGWRARVRQC